MKKVILILNQFRYSNGVARAIIELCNNLDLERFDVTIMPMYELDKKLAKELDPRIKLKKAFGFYFRGFAKLARLIPLRLMYKWWIDKKYDIEIAFQCDIPTLLVCNSQNSKAVHVAWMHGYDCYDSYDKLDKVVCVSKYCADKTKEEMGDRVDVTYRYNLVDDVSIREKAKESIDLNTTEKPLFVSVGRHSPEKGYIRLVKILSELRDEGYQFHLILVGDGPQHKEIKAEIDNRNMGDCITLTSAQKNPHKYTAKADIFICSSFREGYSTACTESAILGVPIITTCVPGGAEIIEECECGRLTTLGDDDLKKAIREVLEKPELITDWKQTLQRTSERFTLEARKRAMTELFDELWNISEGRNRK